MKTHPHGFLLIEVLIAISIMAVIILPLLQYQLSALKVTTETNLASIAQLQLLNIEEMLLASDDEQRNNILIQWNQDNAELLPHGNGFIEIISNHVCRAHLEWLFHRAHAESKYLLC